MSHASRVNPEVWSLILWGLLSVGWGWIAIRVQLLKTRIPIAPTTFHDEPIEELEAARAHFGAHLADAGLEYVTTATRGDVRTLNYASRDRQHYALVSVGLITTLSFVTRRGSDGVVVITAVGPGEPPFPLRGIVRRVSIDASVTRAYEDHVAFAGSGTPIDGLDDFLAAEAERDGFARRDEDAWVLTLRGAHEWATTLTRSRPANVATVGHAWRAAAPPLPESLLVSLHRAFRASMASAPPRRIVLAAGFGSLAAFGVAGAFAWGYEATLYLGAVVLVHELGHALAMRLTGHRDVRIFFLPLLGAVTQGRRAQRSVAVEGLVLLAGPLPGLLVGLALHDSTTPALAKLGNVAFLVNALNLLPVLPFDGGRLLQLVLPARPWVERIMALLSVVGLGALALRLGSWVLVALAIFVGFTAYSRLRFVAKPSAELDAVMDAVRGTDDEGARLGALHRAVRASGITDSLTAIGTVELLDEAAHRRGASLVTRAVIGGALIASLAFAATPLY